MIKSDNRLHETARRNSGLGSVTNLPVYTINNLTQDVTSLLASKLKPKYSYMGNDVYTRVDKLLVTGIDAETFNLEPVILKAMLNAEDDATPEQALICEMANVVYSRLSDLTEENFSFFEEMESDFSALINTLSPYLDLTPAPMDNESLIITAQAIQPILAGLNSMGAEEYANLHSELLSVIVKHRAIIGKG